MRISSWRRLGKFLNGTRIQMGREKKILETHFYCLRMMILEQTLYLFNTKWSKQVKSVLHHVFVLLCVVGT